MLRSGSLKGKYLRLLVVMAAIFLLAAVFFIARMASIDAQVQRNFLLSRQMHLVHQAETATQLLLIADTPERRAQALKNLDHDEELIGTLAPDAAMMVTAVLDVLKDRAPPRRLEQQAAQLAELHHDLDHQVREAQRTYQQDSLSVSVGLGMIAFLPVLLALWPLGMLNDVIHGIEGLRRKVELGRRTGDSRAATVARHDEIRRLGIDIDEMFRALRQREKELQEIRQMRGIEQKIVDIANLGAGIAHEVRNPLMVVTAHLDELEASSLANDAGHADLSQRLEPMRAALLRIDQILGQMTAFELDESEQTEVDVNTLVHCAVGMLRLDGRVRDSRFQLDTDPELPAVIVPRTALMLCMFALLSSMSMLLAERSRITVSTRRRDDGVGIDFSSEPLELGKGENEARSRPDASYVHLGCDEERISIRSVYRMLGQIGANLEVTEDGPLRSYSVTLPLSVVPEREVSAREAGGCR